MLDFLPYVIAEIVLFVLFVWLGGGATPMPPPTRS
jgi:hypothetical protein